jgi:glycosyltransferase involved in cell wall biosynthesis
MKILMIAPEPIFEPRGTPMSVVGRLKALSDMGHHVDLLTYSIGRDIHLSNIGIFRISKIPGIRKVPIGPSLTKIPLDFLLILKSFIQIIRYRYDLIHTHEEAGFWGTLLSKIYKIPHIYDMHSSLPQQLINFQFSSSGLLINLFKNLEYWVLKNASAVITICPDLYDHVENLFPERGSVLIENVIDYGMIFGEDDKSAIVIQKYKLKGKKVALYTGTFEPYQGLDLLIDSAKEVLRRSNNVIFLLVGGHPEQVSTYRRYADKAGVGKMFIFTGQVLPQEVNSYIRCADILLSPRTRGTNTPLKIYSYLRSGVPIVATRLLTHTQVLNETVAVLCDPNPESYAEGINTLIQNRDFRTEIGRNAKNLALKSYSYSVYLKKFQKVLLAASGDGG